MNIPKEQWEWYGSPGHFIASFDCRFHMTTLVGRYVVSTVGEYFPGNRGTEMETVGLNRKYETMVFEMAGRCECGCGLPTIDPTELDMNGYNDAGSATEGHYRMCEKVSGWDD